MFTLNLVGENIFMIVKKEDFNGICFKKLPIEVYGFIQVDLFRDKYGMSFMNIAQEVFDSDELLKLINKARKMAALNKEYH